METLVSAVLGDLVSRWVSFVIDRYSRRQNGAEENLRLLLRVLLRIQATVEEAEGWHITNRAMLHQLQMLREAMYKGWYLFDTFRYWILQQGRGSDQVADQLFALSKSSPSKHLCFFTRRMNMAFQGAGVKEVQNMLGRLYSIIDDVAEFIVFLKSYPPIIREPYNKFLEKCMFGRQAEMEKIISFLLQPVPPRVDSLQVLQIIGPPRVGKSTLVEHIRYDERVHDHFSSIILCSGNSAALEDSGVVKLKTHGSHERSLVIMELADDLILDERQCKHCTLQEATCHLEVKLGADHKQIREYRETWNSGSYETEIFASRSFLVLLQGDGFWKHKS
uniref:Disease resistance N-terminal domain-containing protein n=1 Tax=Arundo donax TaxID=35708 RepID=A0A0A9EM92_ARUDO